MRVVLVSSDLMSVSRIEGAAVTVGATVRVASSIAAAQELIRREPVDLLLIDLALPLPELESFVAQVKQESATAPRVLAYGPHVHEDRLAAARAAGCDAVMSRGQFFGQVDKLLAT
jgi:DNA-binding response OmpR family regulator